MEGELVAPSAEIAHWKDQIVDAWQTSVAHVIKTGLLIQQAKQALGVSYRELEAALPFSASTATYLIKIAQHSVLCNPIYQKSLPNSYNTLYQLTLVDEDLLVQEINSGTITPTLNLEGAKKLKTTRRSSRPSGGRKPKKPPSPQFVFGSISIGTLASYMDFRTELLELLKKHGGRVQYTLKKDSVGEWHLQQLGERAASEIEEIEKKLAGEEFVPLNISLNLKLCLQKNEHTLEKRKVHIDGGERLLPCLGKDHQDYNDAVWLLGSEDITIKHVNKHWRENNLARIQDEKLRQERYLKIWKLVSDFCLAKGDKSVIRKLQKIEYSTLDKKDKDWIRELLSDLTIFSNSS